MTEPRTGKVCYMSSKEKMYSFLSQQSDEAGAANEISTARKRVLDLLDADSFVELGSQILSLVSTSSGRDSIAGEGLISGYGLIDGRLVFVASQDSTVFHGGIGQANSAKFKRTLELAKQAGSPFIALLDGGGIRVDEGLAALDSVGEMYQELLDARGLIPVISLILGPCPGTMSFLPAASDIVIMAESSGGIYLQGPGITAAEENPELKPTDIGGATVHSTESGLASLITEDEAGALKLCRRLFTYLPDHAAGFLWTLEGDDDPNRCELALDDLAENMDDGYEIRNVIDAVFDHDSILELYADFATEIKAGLATIGGQPIIYLANNRRELGLSSADKIETVLSLADRLNFPVITFTDTHGFSSGRAMERSNIASVAARVMAAFCALNVTRINIIVGQAIGQGYLVFNSKVSGADMVYAWPTAEIAVLGADSAVNLFWQKALQEAKNPLTDKAEIILRYRNSEMTAQKAASEGAVDEVIRPSATRPRIYSALQLLEGL